MRIRIFRELKYRMEFFALMAIGAVFRKMPLGAVYSFTRILGLLAYRVIGIRRHITLLNLRQAWGDELSDEEMERIARESYTNIGVTFVEMLLAPQFAGRLSQIVDTSEITVLKRTYERGKGVILVSGHFGSWELNGASIGASGFPLTVVAKRQSNPYVDAWIQRNRESMHMRVINPGAPVKQILRALRNGETVGLISDQDAGSRGVFVNFFGRPASTPRGGAELALRYRIPVVVSMTARTGPGTYRSFFREIEVRSDDSVESLTQRYTVVMEEIIRRYPEQYFWMHRRWKSSAPENKVSASPEMNGAAGDSGGNL